MKELIGRTSEKSERKIGGGTKEVSQSQGSGKKIDEETEEQSTSVSHSLGIKRKVEELQETVEQSFSDSHRSKKGEREEMIKKKKARRTEGRRLTEKEDEKEVDSKNV